MNIFIINNGNELDARTCWKKKKVTSIDDVLLTPSPSSLINQIRLFLLILKESFVEHCKNLAKMIEKNNII